MKFKLLPLCVALVCATHLLAYDCVVDGIYYNLNHANKTAEVTNETGWSNALSYSGTVNIPASINSQTYSVTTIGDRAFSGCSSLTSVTIPNSVTTIGDGAFYYCRGLTSVTIPNSVTTIGSEAFEDCSGLTSIEIPNSVTTIGSEAFEDCSGLTSVTIPNSVTTIGERAFENCSGLTSVTIPNSVTTIGEYAFKGCSSLTSINVDAANTHYASIDGVLFNLAQDTLIQYPIGNTQTAYTIPNSVTTIGKEAFRGCSGLTSVTIPNSVTTIGNSAFRSCSGLTSVTIPNSVTTIGDWAFNACSGLTSVTLNSSAICNSYGMKWTFGAQVTEYIIGDSVTTIGDYAFRDCSGLTSVTIPSSVTAIGDDAFYGCSGLTSINVDAANTHYASIDGVLFNLAQDTLIQYPIGNTQTAYTIPNFVTTIKNNAFSGCNGLTSVTIPNSVTMIGYYAFSGCSGLKSVTWNAKNCTLEGLSSYSDSPFGSQVESFVFGNEVETIPSSLCRGMSQLTSITIPNSVTSIGRAAFANNSHLTDVVIGANVTEIGCDAFKNDTLIKNITCYAPITPNVCNTTFGGLDKSVICLYVPADYQRKYQVDSHWKGFDLHLIGAEQQPISTDMIIVTPSTDNATFTWPANDQADSYSLQITKDGAVFCTLKFNAQGQLTGIAFAPSRGEARTMAAATMTGAGWQFTVTGLNQASKYAYTMDVKNVSQKSIKTYTGEFATDGYTDLLPLPYEGKDGIGSSKFIHNGRLLIEHNGILYNARGARVK